MLWYLPRGGEEPEGLAGRHRIACLPAFPGEMLSSISPASFTGFPWFVPPPPRGGSAEFRGRRSGRSWYLPRGEEEGLPAPHPRGIFSSSPASFEFTWL